MSSQLPMIECSSCGNIVGHLYDDYYLALETLTPIHDDLVTGRLTPSSVVSLFSKLKNGNIFEHYLQLYYEDLVENGRDANLYTPAALVSKALLFHRELRPSDLPLHEHERDPMTCVKYCCTRMFLCDNSKAPY